MNTGVESRIGDFTVPSSWGWLQGVTSNFGEWYGPKPANCLAQPYAAVHFRQAKTNANTGSLSLQTNTVNTNYGTGACPIPPSPKEAQEGQGVYFVTGTR